ncbi:hypothetical protein SAMN04244572_03739 [Azotobacter beijerinckii]|uniref:Uncharacterized protein n=1 Tax=Azotobacter beijerinckii TaxID=170623 RepID=A0A1H6Y9E7_9GAMM|nr:hypothetical protein [Azotobacter beijerinckii]SEJ37861.1 hypothetical protein SAMN04244572_03739 [Azotobacter beijerinckii]
MAIIDKKDQPLQALKQHEYPVASPGEEQAELTTAARDVLAERRRQVEVEGFSLEHDSQYDLGELPAAAACYALFAQRQVLGLRKSEPDHAWPWNLGWWKPGDARSALLKAGALILAEIERLDHQEQESTHV